MESVLKTNAVIFVTYTLTTGSSISDFLLAVDKGADNASKVKGSIAWKLLVKDKQWADLLFFETMDDARNVSTLCSTGALDLPYFKYLGKDDSLLHEPLNLHEFYNVKQSYSEQSHCTASNEVEFAYFNLKEGVSLPEFLIASEKLHNDFISKQKGYVSRKLLENDNMWADLVVWETIEDALNAEKAFHGDAVALE